VADFLATVLANVVLLLLEAFVKWLFHNAFKPPYTPAEAAPVAFA
jgi:hypothetical protein